MNSYIFTKSGITACIALIPYTFDTSHPNYSKVVEAIKEGRFEDVPDLANIARSINAFSAGKLEVDELSGIIRYNGLAIDNSLTERLLSMMKEGFNVNPMIAFLENLMLNPSKRAVDELYGFLEYGKLPITEDGHFIAYKRVRADYKSVHDGQTDNSIGLTVSMPRNFVDDRSENTCSKGLHFCSFEYLKSFSGDKCIILKINPRDVVSIPVDYNNTKGRACSYEVIGELTDDEFEKACTENIFTTAVYTVDDELENEDEYSDSRTGEYSDGWTDEDDDGDDYIWNEDSGVDAGGYVQRVRGNLSQGEYVRGYMEGYADGRAKGVVRFPKTDNDDTFHDDSFTEGYHLGYQDGRGHKRNIYRVN